MKFKLLVVTLSLFLSSCSYFDDDTFTLVCDVNSEWNGDINGVKGHEKKKETVTWNFKNKKIDVLNNFDIYKCNVWDKQNIGCDFSNVGENIHHTESIRIDRMSGVISYNKNYYNGVSKIGESKTYTGKCEKVKQNKF